MCEQTQINYLDGEVVWVKLGSCWWPGEVIGADKLPPDVLPSFRKPPIAVVKFFQESTYEYVKNINSIYKYNCSRKNEFIKKGILMYRSKLAHMEKFPEDVIRAETDTGGDPDILTWEEFQETKKESYAGIFGSASKKSATPGKGKGKLPNTPKSSTSTPVRRVNREKSDYKVHILVQGSKTPSQATDAQSTPSTSRAGSESETAEEKTPKADKPASTYSTPTSSASGVYPCPLCSFTTTRLNVLILHNKTHSATFTPYTPTPARKKPAAKSSPKATPNKTPKERKPRKEKPDKEKVVKKSQAQKRSTEEPPEPPVEAKKPKTEEEIKSSLLADWDDMDEDSNDNSPEVATSPDVPGAAAEPTPAELPAAEPGNHKSDDAPEKPESSSDSKYEFCEDEDWPLEADAGRKIPRVKNPSKRKERMSISIDEDDVAREVAELLNRTTVPDLPAAPEPLAIEENFPEPSIVKSPDKKIQALPESSKAADKVAREPPPTKAIFKTKTFFRSRHSRSQDAIGKYVAEQLNAAERMDAESELNGLEVASSPEARESPPIEPVKVARLAPKIQLKKMKAEAAQMREREKSNFESAAKENPAANGASIKSDNLLVTNVTLAADEAILSKSITHQSNQDVLYPTQEIKPINKDIQDSNLRELHTTERKPNADTPDDSSLHHPLLKEVKPDNKPDKNTHDKNVCEPTVKELNNIIETERIDILDKDGDQEKVENNENERIDNLDKDGDQEKIENNENEKIDNLYKDGDQEKVENNENERNDNLDKDSDQEKVENNENERIDNFDKDGDQKKVENNEKESTDLFKIPESAQSPSKQSVEPFMNESTASAVDALLSVSREADRVTKIISDDPPEDLFEDDNKDTAISNNINGFSEPMKKDDGYVENNPTPTEEVEPMAEENIPVEIPPPEVTHEHEAGIIAQHNDPDETNKGLTHNDELMESSQVPEETSEVLTGTVGDNIPSESDLQIAEALINLPSTAIQNSAPSQHQQNLNLATHFSSESFQEEVVQTINTVEKNDETMGEVRSEDVTVAEDMTEPLLPSNNDSLNSRYETEEEKSQNLHAAQSLVEMSESIDHKIKVSDPKLVEVDNLSSIETSNTVQNTVIETHTVEQKIASLSSDSSNDPNSNKSAKFETTSSKLLKILEEPCVPKIITKTTPTKQVIVTGKEKILNFDVTKGAIKPKPPSPKQKIIIRRNTPSKNIINSLNEIGSQDNIILSRTSKPPQDGSSMQTYTIQATPDTPSDANTIIIQQKMRKVTKTAPKLQKLKQQYSLVTPMSDSKPPVEQPATDDTYYDINSMPIVLGDDILTPENIDKMPIVMSDGKIITNPANPPKLIKTKNESEKIAITSQSKPELKTLLMNPVPEVSKATTPNILSKSSKLRASKPMLVIDKATGKQKIIMTKADPAVKEIKQAPAKLEPVPQSAPKAGKFIILPTSSSPRPSRTQKIVIDPQTGKAHVLVPKPSEPQHVPENKPVSAKLIPQAADAGSPGSTVMIITNAQGAQSRIVLTPEHEKILFPNKQQPKMSQLKTVTHRITTNSPQKTIVTTVGPTRTPNTKIIPKQQKSAIITSKGQLIVGGRVATTAQNIAPMPEIRPKQRIIAAEPKKLAQTVQKTSSEPLIFLQQKSGAVMQLTTAQFEHLQRTGQIVHKPAVPENKIVVQKQIAIPSGEIAPAIHKKTRRPATMSPAPAKKAKQEIAIAPAPAPAPAPALSISVAPAPVPALTPLSSGAQLPAASGYSELDNFEELLPSTAIARPPSPSPAPAPEPAAAPLADGQLLAVPGEHFGGPPGSFYLCVEDNGSLTPIDNRPLVLENNQLVPMGPEPPPPAPERRDILEAALANSDVFHEPPRDDTFRDLNANVSVHCRVSETSTTLHQPIMTPVEVPSHAAGEPAVPSSLEDGLAVIGVTPHCVPTSLELPITVTDPRIAPRVADPLAALAEPPGPMSMPLLLEEEAGAGGKSLPMLTDEPAASAAEEGAALWSRRLLTPGSDTSEASAEIPLQPAMRLSVDDLAQAS